jgi:hypothetical protein
MLLAAVELTVELGVGRAGQAGGERHRGYAGDDALPCVTSVHCF